MKRLNLKLTFVNLQRHLHTHFFHDQLRSALGLQRLEKKPQRMTCPLALILTFLVDFRLSHCDSLKHFYEFRKDTYLKETSYGLPSYSRLILWINRLGPVFHQFLQDLKKPLRNKELAFVDSTVIPTSELYCWGKSHPQASKAYSSTGQYYGFKLHVITNSACELVNFHLSSGKTHDLDPIKHHALIPPQSSCTLLGDSGYLSKDLYFKLMAQGVDLIAKPKPGMGSHSEYSFQVFTNFQTRYQRLYRLRFRIERLFHVLKHHYHMKVQTTHSSPALLSHVLSALWVQQTIHQKQTILVYETI